jgi:hypothetical protein
LVPLPAQREPGADQRSEDDDGSSEDAGHDAGVRAATEDQPETDDVEHDGEDPEDERGGDRVEVRAADVDRPIPDPEAVGDEDRCEGRRDERISEVRPDRLEREVGPSGDEEAS